MAIKGDNPVVHPDEDLLSRADLAASFASTVLALDASRGLVVGVLGPWGSGKTSFINFARGELARRKVPVIDFNPWMFSGAEQLVDSFFVEVAAQLKLTPSLADTADSIREYGEAFGRLSWLPLVGGMVKGADDLAKLVAILMKRRDGGIGSRRAKVEAALTKVPAPVVIVLDDIDRLSAHEIRDVFKLVRLTANFPNVIYLLSFDRQRVERALGDEGMPGRAYLEKILQLAIDLPALPDGALARLIPAALDDAIRPIERPGHFDDQTWPDIFVEIVQPLIHNMRDVRRYAAAVYMTLSSLEGEIALADVLGLEAVRVFLPDVFALLPKSVEGLTTTTDWTSRREEPEYLKAQVSSLMDAGGPQGEIVRAMVSRLFPGGARHLGGMGYSTEFQHSWLKARRLAHADVLRLYLERTASPGLRAFRLAEGAWARLADGEALDEYLRRIDPQDLGGVISELEAYQRDYRPDQVVPGVVVLTNLVPTMPETKRGMFDFGKRMVVGRVTLRLLRSLKEPEAILEATRRCLPEIASLSGKLEIIGDVGHRDGVGHKLVSEDAARELESEWRAEVRSATPAQLAREHSLMRVILVARRQAQDDEPAFSVPNTPGVTLAVLRDAKHEIVSQSIDRRALRRSPRLNWSGMVETFGAEGVLTDRLRALLADPPAPIEQALVELVENYLSGWRPREMGMEDDD